MITDVEFVGQLDPEIGEEYLRATEFISVMPDYAFLCLRKAGEALCRELANQNDVSLEKLNLKKRINALFRCGVLDEQSKDALHQVRMLCNAGVHKNDVSSAEAGGNQHEGASVDNKQKQVGKVKEARGCFLSVVESVFSAFVPSKPIPTYSVAEIETQKRKDILFEACISKTSESKFKAGLVYEAMGDDQGTFDYEEGSPNSFEQKGIVVSEDVYRHFTYLYEQAAESYDASCYISAWGVRRHKSHAQAYLEGITDDEGWRSSVCDLESLYRYGLLTCDARLGEDKKALGLVRLKAAASRGHVEAAAACGATLYTDGEYEAAYPLLLQAAEQDDVLALRLLYLYYSEDKAEPVNGEVAVEYLQRAIALGCPESLAVWGMAHFEGVVVAIDADEGNSILRKAENMGSVLASSHFFQRKMARKMQSKAIKEYKRLENVLRVKSIAEGQKVRHFDPCPCGSGKKYKKCCRQ